jgi:hypothetical protein
MNRCPELLLLPRARLLDRVGWPAAILAHVDACPRCSAELAAWRQATSLLVDDVPELDSAALGRVERRLRAAAEPQRSGDSRWVWGAAVLAGAAALVVILRSSPPADHTAVRASLAASAGGAPAPSSDDTSREAPAVGARKEPTVPAVGALALDPVRAVPPAAADGALQPARPVEPSGTTRLRLAAERHAEAGPRDDERASSSPSPADEAAWSRSSPVAAEVSDVLALLSHADDARRRRDTDAAIEAYELVAARADGVAFAEEALLRAARLRAARGERDAARVLLAQLRARFPDGALAPERRALEDELDDLKLELGSSAQ